MESVEEDLAHISLAADESDKENLDCSHQNQSHPDADVQQSQSDNYARRKGLDGTPESSERERFMALISKARRYAEEGNIGRALVLNRRALALHYNERLERRIHKMEAFLAEEDAEPGNAGKNMVNLGDGFLLHKSLREKLYAHQKEGVLWLWSLHRKGKGGILADDMGLGKTIQAIAFLAGMFDMGKVKSALIVMTLSLMPVWLKEFAKWSPGIDVLQFHGGSKKEKERALFRVQTRGGVLLTTYGHIVTQQDMLRLRYGRDFEWDYVILDEGHKIKNPTKTSKSIHGIPAKMRLILTGTPVQNNLKELWALYDYVHDGSLLGTLRTFKMEFETPITRSRERDASSVAKRLGEEMSQALKAIIQPYFLRRTKADVKTAKVTDDSAQMPSLTRKNDFVIWLFLSDVQKKIYEDFTNLDDIKELLMTKKSPLVALTVLKKICDHPRLLSTRACLQLGLDGEHFDEEELEKASSYESASTQIDKISNDILISESGKMKVLVDLLKVFKEEGRKCLVFSQSRKLLNIIEKILVDRGHKVARLDGTITQTSEREEIVSKFQRDPKCFVFLLTIQVGGVGLTITSADRVIIYDPSWNPAVDAQAVDRAYRIGQEKNVVIYRLVTCGTVEEKIYRRQIFKDSITQQTTGASNNPYRYFTKTELRELFVLDDPHFSRTQRQLQDMHSNQRITDTDLDSHLAFLHTLDIFGISDHDLMFKQIEIRDDEMEEESEMSGVPAHFNDADFIQGRINQAQALIAQESNNNFTYEQRNKTTKTFSFAFNNLRLDGKSADLPIQLSDEECLVDQPKQETLPEDIFHLGNNSNSASNVAKPTSMLNCDVPESLPLPSRSLFSHVSNSPAQGLPIKEESFSPMKLFERGKEQWDAGKTTLDCSTPYSDCADSPQSPILVADSSDSDDDSRSGSGSLEEKNGDEEQVLAVANSACQEYLPGDSFLLENNSKSASNVAKPTSMLNCDVPESLPLPSRSLFSHVSNSPAQGSPIKEESFSPMKLFERGKEQGDAGKTTLDCSPPYSDCADSPQGPILVADSSDSDDDSRNGSGSLEEKNGDEEQVCAVANSEDDESDDNDYNNIVEEDLFNDLVSVARTLYKSKEYEESLTYVKKALTIFQEPGLEEMAAKIRMRIQESSL